MTSYFFLQLLLGLLVVALLFCVYTDISKRLIYDKVNIAIAAIAPLFWLADGTFTFWGVGFHLLTTIVAFGLFAIFFHIGAMGGGDLKLITALSLWFQWDEVIRLMFVASLAGGVVTIIFAIIHKLKQGTGRARIPYGVAIAIGGLWSIGERFFNQFTG